MKHAFFRTTAATAAALLLAGAGLNAAAQPAASAPAAPAPNTATAAMGFQQVIERVVAKGYSDVREVERKGDKLFEVTARDAQGRRAELLVDARSGEILREEVKR